MSARRLLRRALSGLALLGAPSLAGDSARSETLLLAPGSRESLPVSLEIRFTSPTGEADRTVGESWDRVFETLGRFFDRDGDRRLDRTEAARLPAPFALRQTLWGRFALDFEIGRQAPELKEGETLSFDDLAAHYRRHGLGDVIVATGRVEATKVLNESLLRLLDADRNGAIEAGEWRNAEKALAPLDFNDDELIGPGELDRRVPSYPGTSGTVLVKPQSTPRRPGSEPATFLLLAGDKLAAIHPRATRRSLVLTLPDESFGPAADASRDRGASSAEEHPATFSIEGLEVRVRTERGRLPARVGELATTGTAWFDRLDANRDGMITPEEADGTQLAAYRRLANVADRDDDRRLTRVEHAAWLELERQVAAAQVLVTVIDYGRSRFEQLDADHDGGLSVRELRTAEARLAAVGRSTEPEVPLVSAVIVSRGHPRSLLQAGRRGGPSWFQAMDRNGDGDVSRREWLLEAEAFEKYDADRDGLISSVEAGPDIRSRPDPR